MKDFKGITFDDYTTDEDGHIWSQICEHCLRNHASKKISNYVDDHGGGVCGVKGCNNTDEDSEINVYYIDFEKSLNKEIL